MQGCNYLVLRLLQAGNNHAIEADSTLIQPRFNLATGLMQGWCKVGYHNVHKVVPTLLYTRLEIGCTLTRL